MGSIGALKSSKSAISPDSPFFVSSPNACALYKAELDKHLPEEYSTVGYSPGYNDPPELAKYHLSTEEEKRIRKAFRKPDELPKILIVTEKLLTGFDAPILYCILNFWLYRHYVLYLCIYALFSTISRY